ncbi:hypothetical protein [Anaerosporobacter faecicola]|uniref:hypothetical protein n=1 Tax=Anaerosporobacter faecicola TaxID=2718714 RepID=UPI00143C6EF0|nr:hypothetical protein [Anaerosporobacter faecicola]
MDEYFKAKCKNNSLWKGLLTVGKGYNVTAIGNGCYYVIDDTGEEDAFPMELFDGGRQ